MNRLWLMNHREIGRVACFLGIHVWDTDCDAYSNDEWTACQRCLRMKRGSLRQREG
jgi:hypothetical protein